MTSRHPTIGSNDRGVASRSPNDGIDDWDKASRLVLTHPRVAHPRRQE
jgi:hypothetical protein